MIAGNDIVCAPADRRAIFARWSLSLQCRSDEALCHGEAARDLKSIGSPFFMSLCDGASSYRLGLASLMTGTPVPVQ